jgi:hypothetical protein
VYLGVISAIPDAGKVNAIASVNLVRRTMRPWVLPPHDPGLIGPIWSTTTPRCRCARGRRSARCGAPHDEEAPSAALHPNGHQDQMETIDLRTTDDRSRDSPMTGFNDGTLVAKLRRGAIMSMKDLMDEYAARNRSSHAGHFCNPYATDRDTGGSSANPRRLPRRTSPCVDRGGVGQVDPRARQGARRGCRRVVWSAASAHGRPS